MGPVIQQDGGFVNQFYGDGIMALFLDKPDKALKASVAMLRTLNFYNDERSNKDRQPLRIGIGLHIGSLMMGMIGDDKGHCLAVSDRGRGVTALHSFSWVRLWTDHWFRFLSVSCVLRGVVQTDRQFDCVRLLGAGLGPSRASPPYRGASLTDRRIELFLALDDLVDVSR